MKHVRPNQLAMTREMRSLLNAEHVPIEYVGSALHGIALLNPRFEWNALDQIDSVQEQQRAFFARLAAGANNVGHVFFLYVVDYLPLEDIKTLPRDVLYSAAGLVPIRRA